MCVAQCNHDIDRGQGRSQYADIPGAQAGYIGIRPRGGKLDIVDFGVFGPGMPGRNDDIVESSIR